MHVPSKDKAQVSKDSTVVILEESLLLGIPVSRGFQGMSTLMGGPGPWVHLPCWGMALLPSGVLIRRPEADRGACLCADMRTWAHPLLL